MPSDALLTRAARLRAAGLSWESVAAKLGRRPDTLMTWPERFADRWEAALGEAERRVAVEAAAEGVLMLRQLLRAADEAVRRAAARALLDLRYRHAAGLPRAARPTSPRSAEARRLVAFIEANTHDIPLIPLDQFLPPLALPAGPPGGAVPPVEV